MSSKKGAVSAEGPGEPTAAPEGRPVVVQTVDLAKRYKRERSRSPPSTG